jgi:hypothetical protein
MYFIPLFLLLPEGQLLAQAPEYGAALIPAKLKRHANAVIRDEQLKIDIAKPGEVWITEQKVITVLNPNGKQDGAIRIYYNKSRPVQSVSGALYDGDGNLLRKFRKSDFQDVSMIGDFSLFEDDRMKRLLPAAPGYPYTVRYRYRQKYKFTLYLPKWLPVNTENVSVAHASFQLSSPTSIPVRYHGWNLGEPVIDSSGKKTVTCTWKLQDLGALTDEPYSPPFFRAGVPVLIVAPERFAYYGMKGQFDDWKQYGKWVYGHLLKGRDVLPQETVSLVRQMTAGDSSAVEKAKRLYNYAQRKNRYVSIQIGKGGFEPMSASRVDEVSYGDCKALVNYMMALLKAAGIPSYYTEVYAGDDPISLQRNFASAGQGNHIILCVPFAGDTTWLECTDKHMPFGFLGTFTDDRNVLVITPEGGVLTRTPLYPDTCNTQQRTAVFKIDSAGNLLGKMTTTFAGLRYQQRQPFEMLSRAERIRYTKARYARLLMDVSAYSLAFIKHSLPEIKEKVSFTSRGFAALGPHTLSIPLNPVDRFGDIPAMAQDRKNQVYIARGYVMTDTLRYGFPAGYAPALIPKAVHLVHRFGAYDTRLKTGDDGLTYIRTFRLKSGYYPSGSYQAFIAFLRAVSGYDRQHFVIRH